MVVIITAAEHIFKNLFPDKVKEFEEKGESIFFLTPDSNNECLKSCTINEVYFDNPQVLGYISETELDLLYRRLRQEDGNYALFRKHYKSWVRHRFITFSVEDYRPLIFNPKYPWWCSGQNDESATIVAWLPKGEDLKQYWDDATDIESTEHSAITFSSRFPKPAYFEK